jgi:hypothetical protein
MCGTVNDPETRRGVLVASRKKRRAWLLAPALAAALLAGCSSDPGPGPLGNGGDQSFWCMSGYSRGQIAAAGIWDLDNGGKSPVTFTRFVLPATRRLRLATKAWLVPIAHTGSETLLIGDGGTWPPHQDSIERSQWAKRVPLMGAVLRPGQDRNLVFGVTWTSGHYGSSAGPRVTYKSAGQTYTLSEHVRIAVSGTCNNVPG